MPKNGKKLWKNGHDNLIIVKSSIKGFKTPRKTQDPVSLNKAKKFLV